MDTVTTPRHPIPTRVLGHVVDDRDTRVAWVRFEACTSFRSGDDAGVCDCGWLEDEHAPTGAVLRAA